MNIKLKSFAFEGIKNIDKRLEINFIAKKKVTNTELEDSTVTALYGPNGAGKSAFIQAVMLYKKITLDKACLIRHSEYIKEYKNYNSEHITLEATFVCTSERYNTAEEVNHFIKIDSELKIIEEKIERKSRMLQIENGLFSSNNILTKTNQNKFINLLSTSSLVSLSLPYINDDNGTMGTFNNIIKVLVIGAQRISIVLEDKDDNFQQIYLENNDEKITRELLKSTLVKNMKDRIDILKVKKVEKENLDLFSLHWYKIGEFLKIVKPEIKGIYIKYESIDDEYQKPTIFLKYQDYKINIMSESVGILKLVKLYNNLYRLVNNGSILLIDEFDAHLHDVLVTEILDYIISNEEGQFIFTTHNIMLMEELKFKKDAIQFLDLEGNINTWSRKGNSSPEKAYRSGLITNDFKYGIFDFDRVMHLD